MTASSGRAGSAGEVAAEAVAALVEHGRVPGVLLAPGAVVALAPGGESETGARLDGVDGPPRGPRAWTTVHRWDCGPDRGEGSGDVLVLGTAGAGEDARTTVVSVSVRAGSVARLVEFSTPRRVLWDAAPCVPQDAGRAVFDAYMSALDAGEARAAAECFSRACTYSHPPYVGRPGDSVFEGRDAVRAAFERRGAVAFEHRTLRSGSDAFGTVVEGVVPEVRGTSGSFVGLLRCDAEGLIDLYQAFYCEPGVVQVG